MELELDIPVGCASRQIWPDNRLCKILLHYAVILRANFAASDFDRLNGDAIKRRGKRKPKIKLSTVFKSFWKCGYVEYVRQFDGHQQKNYRTYGGNNRSDTRNIVHEFLRDLVVERVGEHTAIISRGSNQEEK